MVLPGVDIETTALDPEEGEISLLQVADPERRVVDVYDAFGWDELPVPGRGIAHNAMFEERWLRAAGYNVRYDDTMIASLVFYTGTNAARSKQFSHSLQAAVKRELHRELSKEEQDSDWSALALTREQLKYAARDAHVLPELAERLLGKLEQAGLGEVYELERRVSPAVDAMQKNAFAVNEAKLDPLVEEVTEQAERLKAELEEEWGINPGSSKQLREYFELDKRAERPT